MADDQFVCCGAGSWSPKGKEPNVSCQLCPKSPTYWRRPENRPDGRPYEPVRPLGDGENVAGPE